MIEYNIVMYCYDKIFVNVAVYIILQWIMQNITKYNTNKIKYNKNITL